MASITIRNLDDDVKERLRVRAAENGRSMEAEARHLLEASVASPYAGMNIAQAFRAMAERIGYLDDLELPSREDPYERPIPYSDEWENERAEYMAELEARNKPDKAA